MYPDYADAVGRRVGACGGRLLQRREEVLQQPRPEDVRAHLQLVALGVSVGRTAGERRGLTCELVVPLAGSMTPALCQTTSSRDSSARKESAADFTVRRSERSRKRKRSVPVEEGEALLIEAMAASALG